MVLAHQLVAEGKTAHAIATLENAGIAGDVDSLMQLAVWHLAGHPVPRNLARARHFLRSATAIGHVDAALMEIALTANGSGAVADWQGALALLQTAAQHDPVAADQIALIETMQIDALGWPTCNPAAMVLSESPRIARAHCLFTPAECAHVATIAAELLEPSTVLDPRSGRRIAHPIRTSDSGAIGPAKENMVIRALNMRIAAATGTDVEQGEPLTILHYRPGQQYRPHLDTIDGAANQRIKTVLVYLNDNFEGGETAFPLVPLTFKPGIGDAIIFDNTLPDGSTDTRLRHAGLSVRRGVKWLSTRWIRAKPVDPWTIAELA